jgi:hypothetical protein
LCSWKPHILKVISHIVSLNSWFSQASTFLNLTANVRIAFLFMNSSF